MRRPASTGPSFGRASLTGVFPAAGVEGPARAGRPAAAGGRWGGGTSRAVSGAKLEPPAVSEPRHAGIAHARAHGKGVEAAVVVVGVPVARVDGHVEEVLTLDQVQGLDFHRDDAPAVDLTERQPLHCGVGAIAADPVLAKHADAEHGVLDRAMRAEGEMDDAGLACLEKVALLTVRPRELDARQLDLPASPARGAAGPGERLGLGVLHAERPGLEARYVLQVPAHHLAGLAVHLQPSPVEPHRLVAEALDAAEVMGDEHDGLPVRLELLDLAHA